MVSGPSARDTINNLRDQIGVMQAELRVRDAELQRCYSQIKDMGKSYEIPQGISSDDQKYQLSRITERAFLLTMAAATLMGVFYLLDRKIPNRADLDISSTSQAPRKVATSSNGKPPYSTTSTPITYAEPLAYSDGASANGRSLVFSAIEAYIRRPENAGRALIPGEELAEKVIEPLTKAGLISAETGKALLTSAMDGGKTLATDYFHQKWESEFKSKDDKAANNSIPTVVCSPVFNAAPSGIVRSSQPRPTAIRQSQPKMLAPAPVCSAPPKSTNKVRPEV